MADIIILGLGGVLLVVGAALLAFEIVHPGVFLVIPATIFLAAGILYILFGPAIFLVTWGPAVIIVAAVASAFATIPWYRHLAPIQRPMSTTVNSLEGEVGIVISPVIPHTLRGKVQVRSEVWSARSERPIEVGTKVRIVGGEGVSVWVQPVESANLSGSA